MQHILRFVTPLAITIISFFLSTSFADLNNLLRYDRDSILNGEIWRVLTGNFTHAGLGHWFVNMFGLWLLWFIYVNSKQRQLTMLSVLFITCLGTCVGLFFLEPQLKWYVGLSGALHGFFAAGIILFFKSEPKIQMTLAVLLAMKLIYEQFFGSLPGSAEMTGMPVLVNSHLYGAITGVIAGFLLLYRKPARETD